MDPMAQVPNVSTWSQFGLGGAVIVTLFGTLWFFIKQHYLERKEWRDDFKAITTQHDNTVKETSDKFITLHEKTLEAIRRKDSG